jgi:hypothetical protein
VVGLTALAAAAGLAPGRMVGAPAAELAVGTLSITVPANPTAAAGSPVAGTVVTVNLGTTTVADSRVGSAGWTVTADATTLSGGGHSIAKSQLSWQTKNLTATSGLLSGVSVGGGGTFGATPLVVATAVSGAGLGTYTYTATVTLVVPANTYATSYSTTITQTAV